MKKKKLVWLQYVPVALFCLVLAVLPFNIVYHFYDGAAYVDGYFVNYLDFVVHIVDIVAVLLLGWLVVAERVWKSKKFVWAAVLLGVFVLVHNIVFRNYVVLYFSVRLLVYGLAGCGLVEWLRSCDDKLRMQTRFYATLTLLVVAVLQAVVGILQFGLNRTLGLRLIGESIVQVGGFASSSVYLPDGYHLRGYGTFPHPNVLGGFLVLSAIILLYAKSKYRWFNILKWISLGVISAGILVTWSRTAWLCYLLVLVVWIISRSWIAGMKWFIASVVVLVIGAGCLAGWIGFGRDSVSESLRERLINQSTSSDVSYVEREQLAERSVEMIKENGIFGVGMGGFIPEMAEDPVVSEKGVRLMQPVHNVFLLVLSEIGVVGAAFLVAAGAVIISGSRVNLMSVSIWLVFVLVSLFDHYLWSLPQGLGMWIFAAVLALMT